MRRTSRRSILLGCAGAGVATSPLFQTLAAPPRDASAPNLIFVYTPNGVVADEFGISDTGEWRSILEPLSAFEDRLLLVEGLHNRAAERSSALVTNFHSAGLATLLSAVDLIYEQGTAWGGGVSVDQILAQRLGQDRPLASLELSVGASREDVVSRLAYAGAAQPLPPCFDPQMALQRAFAETFDSESSLLGAIGLQTSILDVVALDLDELSPRLASRQRARLGAHLQAVRDVERRIGQASLSVGACGPPTLNTQYSADPDVTNSNWALENDSFPEVAQAQVEVLVAALGCGVTRFSSLMLGPASSEVSFRWLGIDAGHHTLSHEGDSNAAAQSDLLAINRWQAERVAELLTRLEAASTETGSLLDDTVVVWLSEVSKGNTHSFENLPCVILDGTKRLFKTGRVDAGGRAHGDLLAALCQAFRLDDISRVGAPEDTGGVLESTLR